MNKNDYIKKSFDYIEDNLLEDICLDTLSDEAHFSKYHFHRLFRAGAGYSVMDYISRRRIVCAARELIFSDEKMTSIAFKYRFNSQDTFIRAFKRVYGVTPGQFRRDKML
ncbi:MAG: helix-turn-helix transcriptional regulator [Bacillota bacterium]